MNSSDNKTTLEQASQDCILFSTADWNERYWTNKQHTTCELAKLGWRVLYIESIGLRSPRFNSQRDWSRLVYRFFVGLKCLFLGAQKVQNNIWVLSPLTVPGLYRNKLFSKLNNLLLQHSLQRFRRGYNFDEPVIWTYHPYILNMIRKFKGSLVIYHNVDDISVVPGVDKKTFKTAELELLNTCDLVFATSTGLKDHCAKYHSNVKFYPNVVDYDHFSRARSVTKLPTDLECISEPRVGYHGVLSDFKLDFKLLYDVISLNSDISFVFLGEEREGQNSAVLNDIRNLPNAHFLGFKKYELLPQYLGGFSLGLLPTLINEYTDSMFPMKYFEYLAAGLRVVSTPLAFSQDFSSALLVAATPKEFGKAIGTQLTKPKLTKFESEDFIGENTWNKRTLKMVRDLQVIKKSKS